MALTPKKLDEVLPPELAEFSSEKITEWIDKPLVIHSCREAQGQRGTYMRIVVSEQPDGKKFHLATGASQPMEILSYLDKHLLFPVIGKFIRSGNAIVLKS